MPSSSRHISFGVALAALAILMVYGWLGSARPVAEWRWIDLLAEGGTALMATYWMRIVLGSRPAGRVTVLLALGLAGMALGMWADALDELLPVKDAPRIDKWLESGLMPVGMALLTAGLIGWRNEQFQLSEHMERRERLFRDHRGFDRITQLARVDYLREQVALEQAEHPHDPASLLMLDVTGLQDVLREHGRRDAVRALQAVTHQILLNLRNDDLLCRYSGDRFVLLQPRTPLPVALRTARHLEHMVDAMAFHGSDGRRARLQLRSACATATGDPASTLSSLNHDLEQGGFPRHDTESA